MIRQLAAELRLAWVSLLLPIVIVLVAVLAVLNVANSAQAVRDDFTLLQHTRSEYAKNGMDFAADLRRPEAVTTTAGEQTVNNLARFDYDNLATAIHDIAPSSSPAESLKYFGFLVFPVVFFLIGLWMSTTQRRYSTEKITLVRAGPARAVAGRQLAVVGSAAIITIATLLADVLSRTVARASLASEIRLGEFPPLTQPKPDVPLAQWAVILLIAVFFGAGGVAVGSIAGVFAIPALVFLAWDFILPIVAQNDPRNWFTVLGHAVFNYSASFELVQPIPLPTLAAALLAAGCSVVLVAVGYVGIRIRNPLAH